MCEKKLNFFLGIFAAKIATTINSSTIILIYVWIYIRMYEYLLKQFIFLLAEAYFTGGWTREDCVFKTHNLQTCNFARNKSQNAVGGGEQQNQSADNIDQFNIVVLFDYRFLAQLSNGMCITHPSGCWSWQTMIVFLHSIHFDGCVRRFIYCI